ncbi:TRAP dicarboxylate transporter, DctP subunit (plasmid) [Rhizobium leguminosarum bv. trifolii WSM2304]|uniref:TRAP dicarboxylate transporter, DctP subunit n=1 Tax=Rhizobium leguminosarum bv. trifolii (strain WSM2304) TaxID=395492 RepID=A0ABF7QYV5_RHILW|nr:TRAP transporter substrate-binding protein [Rhizobium leguminosarum]ACI59463.1 TRAP dicarboxylate transporter, DctP subunit [Rhizobium leguminosarum bv. trifolii WSM2304]
MKITRRNMLATTGALALGAAFHTRAAAAEFTYKFANNLPPDHPVNVKLKTAADNILQETGGRLQINLFPSGQLGNDTETLSQLRSGATEFFSLSPLILSTLAPNAAISGMGFAFPDYDTVWRAMDGKLGAYTRAQIEKKGIVPMEKIWDNGFRQITSSSKTINTPDDLKGFKIRVPPSPLWQSLFNAFGAAPVTINAAEMYTALSTGIADGQENALNVVEAFKLFEVQKYCAMTSHMWDGFWLLANKNAWEALPEDVREITSKNFNDQVDSQRKVIAELNTSLRDTLTKRGMTFTDPDNAAFREKLSKSGFYGEWRKKFGEEAWGILEEAVGARLG